MKILPSATIARYIHALPNLSQEQAKQGHSNYKFRVTICDKLGPHGHFCFCTKVISP